MFLGKLFKWYRFRIWGVWKFTSFNLSVHFYGLAVLIFVLMSLSPHPQVSLMLPNLVREICSVLQIWQRILENLKKKGRLLLVSFVLHVIIRNLQLCKRFHKNLNTFIKSSCVSINSIHLSGKQKKLLKKCWKAPIHNAQNYISLLLSEVIKIWVLAK